jgi:hypothetical protein
MMSPNAAILAGLGPFARPLGTPGNTAPLTASGILNDNDLSTNAVLVYDGPCNGRAVRLKIMVLTASARIAYSTVAAGAPAPSIKADGDGSADEGSLIVDGGGANATEWVTILDNQDFYIVASAASTKYQVTAVETP